MPGAVRAPLGTRARHPARPVEPEQIMTKAKKISRPTNKAAQSNTVPTTTEAKAKRPRGKTAPEIKGSAEGPTAVAPTERPAETPITHAITDATSKPPRQTKAALLRARLAEPGGVSLAALIEATGWQAHTLRAYLSGLRKEGLTLTRRREGEDTIYAIEPGGSRASGTAEDITSSVPADAAAGTQVSTHSGEVTAVQGSGDGIDDANSATVAAETTA
jgi:hypothetical protein